MFFLPKLHFMNYYVNDKPNIKQRPKGTIDLTFLQS